MKPSGSYRYKTNAEMSYKHNVLKIILLDYVFSSQRIRYVGLVLRQGKYETANMEGKM